MSSKDQTPRLDPQPTPGSAQALYNEFLRQQEAGEEVDFERFCACNPEHARQLRRIRDGEGVGVEARSLDFPPLPDAHTSYTLLQLAQQEDAGAWNALVERYYERVHRIARIRMSRQLQLLAEPSDIVHRAFMIALRKLEDFRPREAGGLIQWLAKIVENQVRDAVRREGAECRRPDRVVPLASDGETVVQGPVLEAPGPTPSSLVAHGEVKAIYDRCIEELPADHREVLLLRDYAGLDWQHIAQELGRPTIAAVQVLHYRARLKLGALLRARLAD